jgi:hypothetical protein
LSIPLNNLGLIAHWFGHKKSPGSGTFFVD